MHIINKVGLSFHRVGNYNTLRVVVSMAFTLLLSMAKKVDHLASQSNRKLYFNYTCRCSKMARLDGPWQHQKYESEAFQRARDHSTHKVTTNGGVTNVLVVYLYGSQQ